MQENVKKTMPRFISGIEFHANISRVSLAVLEHAIAAGGTFPQGPSGEDGRGGVAVTAIAVRKSNYSFNSAL